jgi:predicted metal-dependent enzyme (double-stranded beta helix superfamily)
MDEPVRAFLARLEPLLAPTPDVPGIAALMGDFATDRAYFDALTAPLDPAEIGVLALHMPERGPRLFLMHRPRGVMSYIHSHGTWAIVAPVRGVETHRQFDVVRTASPDRAELVVASDVRLRPGEAASIVPPQDVHSHGNAGGDDEPYTLIMTGDDQLRFERREYDLAAGTYRDLPAGDFGQLNLPASG